MTDLMTLRAVANVLWNPLRRDRWQRHRETRDLADHGSKPNFRSIGTATIHSVPRELDKHVITDERYIRATIWAEEWPGSKNLVIQLTNDRLIQASDAMHPDTYYAFLMAKAHATCRTPFERTTNRHGTPTLRRNSGDPHMTPAAASALEVIATYADVREVNQHDLDDALFGDDDIDVDEVEAAMVRA